MTDPDISLHNVVKNYDAPGNSVPALAAMSIEVRQGYQKTEKAKT